MNPPENVTHIAMSLAGSCKLELSKGIRGVLGRVLGAVPVVDDGRAEVVTESHRAVVVSRTPTLAKGPITERGEKVIQRLEVILRCISTVIGETLLSERKRARQSSRYLNESSTKVEHTLFFIIRGIQLWKQRQWVSETELYVQTLTITGLISDPALVCLEIRVLGILFKWEMLTLALWNTRWRAGELCWA